MKDCINSLVMSPSLVPCDAGRQAVHHAVLFVPTPAAGLITACLGSDSVSLFSALEASPFALVSLRKTCTKITPTNLVA